MTENSVFSAYIGGVGGEFDLDIKSASMPVNIPYASHNPTKATVYENTIPHAILDPKYAGITITRGNLGEYGYLVHVNFDIYQNTGSSQTYTLYVFRGSLHDPGGICYPNHSAGRVTVPTGQSGEWGGTWIIPPTPPGLGDDRAIRIQLAADSAHSLQFQNCSFRIVRLDNRHTPR